MALSQLEKLERINAALMERVERSMDQQGNAFSLFQTAIGLENRVRRRTDELAQTLRRLEISNRALSAAKEAAEAANISKTRFIAAASHDVLQPLNAANLSVSALAELQTSDQARHLVRQVEQSLRTMDELLRTLLDISRLDSGVMRPEHASVALDPLLTGLRSDFEPIAAARGLTLRFRPSSAIAFTDRAMLRRILQNLVSNAIRYTRRGGVMVGVRRSGGMLAVEVRDTGVGIPESEREAIFEEFHRGSPAELEPAGTGGLGLGLAIVRRMAGALGHELSFRSQVGRGTAFRILVPECDISAPQSDLEGVRLERVSGSGLVGRRVLVVENDRAVLEAMASLLEGWRCVVRLASHATEAIDIVCDGDWRPEIVIADQHLDAGDLGSSVIAAIRKLVGRNLPALIVTADPSDELEMLAHAQAIEMMRKPLKPAELRALMTHLVGRPGNAG